MNTTLLFVEIFIAGLQGLIWVALLTLNLTGYEWLKNVTFQDFGSWSFLISALVFSVAYSLGIIIDRAANFAFHFWDEKIQNQYALTKNKALSLILFDTDNTFLIRHLEYVRIRLRIARSSSLNYLLIIVFSIGLIRKMDFLTLEEKDRYVGIVELVGVIIVALFVVSWYILTIANYTLVVRNHPLAKNRKP